MRRAALLAIVLAGCANLPDVSADQCGNGVLEPYLGEECDGVAGCGAADSANACKLVCDETSAGCPTGWECGADQRCRRPTETFTNASATTMPTSGVSVRDMDGDGADDLLGYDSRGLVTRYGDWDATMGASTRVPMPLNDTGSVTPDVDNASGPDLAVPLADAGWALFVNNGARGLIPAAQSAIALDFPGACVPITIGAARWSGVGKPDMIMSVGGTTLAFIDNDECNGSLDCVLSVGGGTMVDGSIRTAPLGYGAGDGVYGGDQFTAAVVGAQTVSVWGHDATLSRPRRLGTWSLQEPIADGGHISLLQLTGQDVAKGCYDLVVDTGTNLRVVWAKYNLAGDCVGLQVQGGIAQRYDRPPGTVIGTGNLVGVDGILYTQSLIGPAAGPGPTTGGSIVSIYVWDGVSTFVSGLVLGSDGNPHAASVLDYNQDGYPDIALAVDGTSTVDFYLNYQGQGFNTFPVDVGGTARMPVVGDFDGDLHPDVVVAVADPTNPLGRDHLYIIYGDPSGHPPPAQFLGDFVSAALPQPVAGGSFQLTDSLFVTSNNINTDTGVCDRRLAILIGDTSRQLISPYVVLYNPGGGPVGLTPLGMFDISNPGVPQVLAMGSYTEQPSGDLHVIATVLGFDASNNYTSTGIAVEVPTAVLPSYYIPQAHWRSGDLNADGQTDGVALAYDKLAVVKFDGTALTADVQDLPLELQSPVWFDLVDMDGDGDLDIVGTGSGTVLTPDGNVDAPASRYWVIWNHAGAFDVAAATIRTTAPNLYCYDAAVIHSNDSGIPQLLGACYYQTATELSPVLALGTFAPDDDPELLTDTRILRLDGDSQSIQVGDFSGDGLDDIAVLGSTSMTLYRQCRDDEVFIGDGCGGFAAP